jgi:hypothetical protein
MAIRAFARKTRAASPLRLRADAACLDFAGIVAE